MADKSSTPASNGFDGDGPMDLSAALDLVTGNSEVETFLRLDDDDQNTADDPEDADDQDQDDDQSDVGEDDDDAEEDDQGDDQSDEESEAEDDLALFTLDEDGKRQAVDLDSLEVPVTIDGEDQRLAIDELKKGYLRQRDYTRKTQEVSAKVAEATEDRLAELESDFSERSQAIDAIVEVFGGSFDKEPSIEALKQQYGGDEAKAWRALTQWKAVADKMKGAQSLIKQREAEAAQKEQRQAVARVNQTVSSLRESIPEWKDQARFDAESRAMRGFMLKNGLDDDDIFAVLQKPAYVMLIRDAMSAHQQRSAAAKAKKRVKPAPKTANRRSGSLETDGGQSRKRAQLRKRARSGDKAAGIALIEEMLD